jgi:ergothioneine biosynthesis protein EgtB
MNTIASRDRTSVVNAPLVQDLTAEFNKVRNQTESLCQPLAVDDYNIQTMPDVSPAKWHIAHVSWFFETFLLRPYLKQYQPYHPRFAHIFNSYYETVGTFHPRPQRGLLNRPTVKEVFQYRAYVDTHMQELLRQTDHTERAAIEFRTRVGLNHEQQHQELMLTDIKHVFANNPLKPRYQQASVPTVDQPAPLQWQSHDGGLVSIGHDGNGFCYDNELPVHKVYVRPFKIASRLVTNGEFLAFMEEGAYQQANLWLSDAWSTVQNQRWQAPMYWEKIDGQWWQMTLNGLQPVDPHEPVSHVSFYEADAYARWAGHRLVSEAEWELIARERPIAGNLRDSGWLHPKAEQSNGSEQGDIQHDIQQLYGDVWEWTLSPYSPYPGFQPLAGSLGEYNGKFMCSQFVLRGGSCVTPADHIRPTYRNFFYPKDRWQFTGIRLAGDA